MPGPLHGFKVVDLTTVVSGPLATQTLADQGADVIKVEAPRGDHARQVATRRGDFSAAFLNNNRNKRSVVLNLKHPDGLSALRRLAADADALVQNFRPGVAERIGVGEAAVRDDQSGDRLRVDRRVRIRRALREQAGVRSARAGGVGPHHRAGRLRRAEAPPGAHHPPRQGDRHPGIPGHHRRAARPRAHRQGPARAAVDARHRGVLSLELRHGRAHVRGSGKRAGTRPVLDRPHLRDPGRLHHRRRQSEQGVGALRARGRTAGHTGRRAVPDPGGPRALQERTPGADPVRSEGSDHGAMARPPRIP